MKFSGREIRLNSLCEFIVRHAAELLVLIYVLMFLHFRNPHNSWDRIINSDGKGYYGYLPALFIYHDLDYKFVESYETKYYASPGSIKEFRTSVKGRIVNKYFPGVAILLLPFFLLAHFLSWLFGYATDGYSVIYQYSVALAALFYCWLAARILILLLLRIGAGRRMAAFITAIIFLGTNLIFFTVIEPSMSHVYSLFLVTALLYSCFRFFETSLPRWILPIFILLTLIILVRPVNGLIILMIPAMIPKQSSFSLKSIFQNKNFQRNTITGAVLSGTLLFLLFLMWHLHTGHWLVYPYGNERMNLADPHFFSILFSYNRGWFVYTPVAFVSLAGFAGVWKLDKAKFFWMLGFLLLFIFTVSCWWMWYYASKFGQRVFIDIYPVIAILLFYLFSWIRKRKTVIILSIVLIILASLNLFQFYQHAKFIFPPTYITKEIYWDSFFSVFPKARVYLSSGVITAERTAILDMENGKASINEYTITVEKAYRGKKSSYIDKNQQFSAGIIQPVLSNFSSQNRIIRASAMVFPVIDKTTSSLVVDFCSEEKSICYNSLCLVGLARMNHWNKVEYALYVPEDLPKEATVKVYLFNGTSTGGIYLDDLRIDFLSLRNDENSRRIEGIHLPCR